MRRDSSNDPPSSEYQEEAVLDLVTLRSRVEDSLYESVLSFHLALRKVCETVHVAGPGARMARDALRVAYAAAVREVFPWFDLSRPTLFFEPRNEIEAACHPPSGDHLYADYRLKKNKR